MAAVLVQVGHFQAAVQGDGRELGGGHGEDGLQFGLGEEVGGRPPRGARARPVDADQGLAVTVVPLVVVGHRVRDGADLFADAGGLEDAADLVVEVHGARQAVGLGPAFQDEDLVPRTGQQDGQELADRAEADDGHVVQGESVVVTGVTSSHCGCRS